MKNLPLGKKSLFCFLFLLYGVTQLFSQDILWEKSYGGSHAEYLFDVQPTADYGFILAGSSLSNKSGNKSEDNVKDLDFWVWKMDEKGDLDWQKSFGGTGSDILKSIQGTKDGGFILGGTSSSMKGYHKKEDAIGREDIWIIKLTAEGNEEWQKTIGGTGKDILQQIKQTSDGGYIIGGSSDSVISGDKHSEAYGNMDYWVIKLSGTGIVEWEKTFGGIYKDELQSIAQTKDEGFIIGGYSNSPISGNKFQDNYGEGDFWILKLDKKGEVQWQQTVGGEEDDHLFTILESLDGSFIAGGSSASGATGNKTEPSANGIDFWVIKLTETGDVYWQKTFDFGKTDVLTSLVENEDGTLLIGGYAQSETTGLSKSNKKGINDYIALKINADGEELWKATIGSSGEDVLRKLVETRDGGYLLAGTSKGEISRDKNSKHGSSDFWAVKIRDKDKEDKLRHPGLEAIPNPTDRFTNIIVNHDFEKGGVYVYDIAGRELQHFPAESRTIPIDLTGLPVGVYLVKVATDVKTQSVKILKAK